MPCERKHVEAIMTAAMTDYRIGGYPCLTEDAISAALAAADERDAAFERAREAWGVRSHGLITMHVADACDILDAYFNHAKEG